MMTPLPAPQSPDELDNVPARRECRWRAAGPDFARELDYISRRLSWRPILAGFAAVIGAMLAGFLLGYLVGVS